MFKKMKTHQQVTYFRGIAALCLLIIYTAANFLTVQAQETTSTCLIPKDSPVGYGVELQEDGTCAFRPNDPANYDKSKLAQNEACSVWDNEGGGLQASVGRYTWVDENNECTFTEGAGALLLPSTFEAAAVTGQPAPPDDGANTERVGGVIENPTDEDLSAGTASPAPVDEGFDLFGDAGNNLWVPAVVFVAIATIICTVLWLRAATQKRA